MREVTSQQALEWLEAGNRRFRAGEGRRHDPFESRRDELLRGQRPLAVVLTCSDSRVAPEIVFDTGLGELFVVRVAGNLAEATTVASTEFAVSKLGVGLVVVLGHQDCGAVAATLAGEEATPSLEAVKRSIEPALEGCEGDIDRIARRNAGLQARRLLEISELLRSEAEEGRLEVVSGFLALADGSVDIDQP